MGKINKNASTRGAQARVNQAVRRATDGLRIYTAKMLSGKEVPPPVANVTSALNDRSQIAGAGLRRDDVTDASINDFSGNTRFRKAVGNLRAVISASRNPGSAEFSRLRANGPLYITNKSADTIGHLIARASRGSGVAGQLLPPGAPTPLLSHITAAAKHFSVKTKGAGGGFSQGEPALIPMRPTVMSKVKLKARFKTSLFSTVEAEKTYMKKAKATSGMTMSGAGLIGGISFLATGVHAYSDIANAARGTMMNFEKDILQGERTRIIQGTAIGGVVGGALGAAGGPLGAAAGVAIGAGIGSAVASINNAYDDWQRGSVMEDYKQEGSIALQKVNAYDKKIQSLSGKRMDISSEESKRLLDYATSQAHAESIRSQDIMDSIENIINVGGAEHSADTDAERIEQHQAFIRQLHNFRED